MKPPGCHFEFWQGSVGLSTDLTVFDGGDAAVGVGNLSDRDRVALANYMIDLWTRFRNHGPLAEDRKARLANPVDPVVELSRTLLTLWNALDGAEKEFQGDAVRQHVADDARTQLSEWKNAVETEISFTKARTAQGALVQLTLALDAVDDVSSALDEEEAKQAVERIEMKLHRLIRSAIDAIRGPLQNDIDPAVRSIVTLYGGGHEVFPKWIDRVPSWAEKGSVLHQQEGE
jgi:hypothetical protein